MLSLSRPIKVAEPVEAEVDKPVEAKVAKLVEAKLAELVEAKVAGPAEAGAAKLVEACQWVAGLVRANLAGPVDTEQTSSRARGERSISGMPEKQPGGEK